MLSALALVLRVSRAGRFWESTVASEPVSGARVGSRAGVGPPPISARRFPFLGRCPVSALTSEEHPGADHGRDVERTKHAPTRCPVGRAIRSAGLSGGSARSCADLYGSIVDTCDSFVSGRAGKGAAEGEAEFVAGRTPRCDTRRRQASACAPRARGARRCW